MAVTNSSGTFACTPTALRYHQLQVEDTSSVLEEEIILIQTEGYYILNRRIHTKVKDALLHVISFHEGGAILLTYDKPLLISLS